MRLCLTLAIADAVSHGAVLRFGGGALDGPGCVVSPAGLSGVTSRLRVMREETFGPLVAIARFADEADAVAMANDTPFGLAAYCFASRCLPRLAGGGGPGIRDRRAE